MYKKFLLVFAIFSGLIPGILSAETSELYIGINAANFDSKYNSYEPEGGIVQLGWDMNNWLALEVAAGTSSKYSDETTGDSSQVDYVAGAFLRFNIRLDRITLYAMGGYSKAKQTSTSGSVTTIDETSGGSLAYGIDFYGTRDLALSVKRIEFFDIEDQNNPNNNAHLGATLVGITYYYDTPKIRRRY